MSLARLVTAIAVIALPLGAARAVAVERVAVPLTVPDTYLEARAAILLEMDSTGFAELSADPCKRLELWDLQVDADDDALRLTVNMRAHAGISLWDACRGPDPLDGQIVMRLLPSAAQDGQAVQFQALSAEVRAADGSDSLLTTPSRMLAEKLLLPRLQALRVDVGESLRSIDELLERFLGVTEDAPPALAERGHLTRVGMSESGMQVVLNFALNEREIPDLVSEAEPPLAAANAGAGENGENSPAAAVAALTATELTEWQRVEDELDGFLTVVIAHLGSQTEDRDLQLDLLALLIESRERIAELLLTDGQTSASNESPAAAGSPAPGERAGESDPLRVLFLDTWERLAALVARLPQRDTGEESGLRLASFLAAGDALRVMDALGPAFGIEVSRDGLRRLARLLMAGEAPVSFTPLPLTPDATLQRLFGFGADLPAKETTAPTTSWLWRLNPVAPAFAEEPGPAELLRQIFPRRATLDNYLTIVAQLIAETLEAHWSDSRLTEEQRALFEPLVRATAWKETCWRHYLPKDNEVVVIRSPVGAVGMMQIVGRVWRSVFDLERLEADVAYNLAAGVDILEHYFLDYAVRKGEHKQPGGMDNLVKATYAAYNGGPSKLTRYRRENVAARARAVDTQFYRQYLIMREQPWPNESRCYSP